MPDVRAARFPLLLASVLVTASLPGRWAQAGIILAVGAPQNNGVMVFDGALQDFAPASDSPAHASVGNGRASLHMFGSQMQLSFEVSGTALASTGIGPSDVYFGPIPILIQGTSGEANGTPVSLQLEGQGNSLPPGEYTKFFLNGTAYSPNQQYTFSNLSVGSQFDLWAGLQGDGRGNYTMVVALSISPVGLGGPSPVPEPSSWVLISSGLSAMLVAWHMRKREERGSAPGAVARCYQPLFRTSRVEYLRITDGLRDQVS
jgi:hypothetical protein